MQEAGIWPLTRRRPIHAILGGYAVESSPPQPERMLINM